MGAWFSSWFSDDSSNEVPHRPQTYFPARDSFQQSIPRNNTSTLRAYNGDSYNALLSNYSRVASSQCIVNSYQSHSLVRTVDSTLCKFVLELTAGWNQMDISAEFELYLLPSGSKEYEEIRWLFKKTTQRQFVVTNIYRVQNPYLWGCYLLKKQEITSRYGYVQEEYLFHGTKEMNRGHICRNNFNWRKHGESVGNVFGKGVSFSPISCYASHYSDKHNTQRMMFVSKVLIAKETEGNKNMKIPPVFDYTQNLRYDTAIKKNRQVIVKFSDNEFYPAYVVYYTGQYIEKIRN